MPIWLRKYTFNKIKKWYDSQNINQENEDSWVKGEAFQTALKSKKELDKKNITSSTYVTKALPKK